MHSNLQAESSPGLDPIDVILLVLRMLELPVFELSEELAQPLTETSPLTYGEENPIESPLHRSSSFSLASVTYCNQRSCTLT